MRVYAAKRRKKLSGFQWGGASAFATSFDVQNSRNVKASFLPAGPDWVKGDATVVSGRVTYRQGEATGALPGGMVKGQRTAA